MTFIKQTFLDKISIGASALCAIHCALLPVVLTLFPAISLTSSSNDELFHLIFAFIIVPLSLLAGYMGCAKHKDKIVFLGIISGLVILIFTAIFGHSVLGEVGEKAVTLFAGFILAITHWRNYLLSKNGKCHSPSENQRLKASKQ